MELKLNPRKIVGKIVDKRRTLQTNVASHAGVPSTGEGNENSISSHKSAWKLQEIPGTLRFNDATAMRTSLKK